MRAFQAARTVIGYHPVPLTAADIVRLVSEGASGTPPMTISLSTARRALVLRPGAA